MYEWTKALHIISIISWMAGMLYLPRLFIYHFDAEVGSDKSETFKIMERKLLKMIMTPAMMLSWLFGLSLVYLTGAHKEPWFMLKFVFVIILTVMHMAFAKWRKQFEKDERPHSAKFFKIMNEVPAVCMIVIVILVVVKPI